MQDFLERLDQQLSAIAATPELASAPSAGPVHRLRRVIAGAIAALIAGVGVFAMTGTSTAELPIFGTPTTDATKLRDRAPGAAKLGVDFSAAHRFGTPSGPGYVLAGLKTDAVCLVVPDPTAPGDFGTSCAPTLAAVERRGLRAEFPGDLAEDPDATALSVFLLPDGATDVRLTVGGHTSAPKLESGVLVTDLPTEGLLRWTVAGRPAKRVLEGPFAASTYVMTLCPDGTRAPMAPPPAGLDPERLNDALRAQKKKACAR